MTMEEMDLQDLGALLDQVLESELDDSGWNQVDQALSLIEKSPGADSEDWITGRNDLFILLTTRTGSVLGGSPSGPGDGRDPQTERSGKPAPRQTREHLIIMMHRVGHVPRQERRVDDSA